jgi:predicted RNA-binding Zn ribbon-like protein
MSRATAWVDDHFIAGDPALDFANTVYRRTPELGADLLNNPEAFTSWLARTKLLPPPEESRGDRDDGKAVLREARALRALLWAIFDAQGDGRALPADALAGLLDVARRGTDGVRVHPDGSMTPLTPQDAFAILALRGVRLALSPPPQGVRACDGCGWFFIDTSRGRRRRWCSMKTCGNLAKAARYRSTHS